MVLISVGAQSPHGYSASSSIKSMKNPSDPVGNRTLEIRMNMRIKKSVSSHCISAYFCSSKATILITKNFVYYTYKHNYVLPISTVRIQLHVSVLHVDHLQVEVFNLQISYKNVWGIWVGGGRGRDYVVSIVGTVTPSC